MGVDWHSLFAITVPPLELVIRGTAIYWLLFLLLRFVVNDRWVFRQSQITLQRLWQYHVAMASSFMVWWVTTNAIVFFGGHYMVATVIGMACSILISIGTNFFWIWTRRVTISREAAL